MTINVTFGSVVRILISGYICYHSGIYCLNEINALQRS